MKILSRTFSVLPLAAAVVCAGLYGTVSAQEQQKPAIRVNVNLVSILAIVIDANGRPVPDLTQDAFELKGGRAAKNRALRSADEPAA